MEIDLILVFSEVARGARSEPRRLAAALRSHGVSAIPLTVEEWLETHVSPATAVLLMCGRERITKPVLAFLKKVSKTCLVAPQPALLSSQKAATNAATVARAKGERTALFAFAGVFSHAYRNTGEVATEPRVPVYAATSELLVAHHALETSGASPRKAPIVRVDMVRGARGVWKSSVEVAPQSLDSDSGPDSALVIARAADAIQRWRTANRLLSGATKRPAPRDRG